MRYVVGLMFDEAEERVLLIRKKRGPSNVIGRWNGIGGHIESGEQPVDAMVREFKEETGFETTVAQWRQIARLRSSRNTALEQRADVFFFAAHCDEAFLRYATITDEKVEYFWIDDLYMLDEKAEPVMANILWMIPFVKDKSTQDHVGILEFDSRI